MQQLDFFHSCKEDYLYEELQKTKTTVEELRRSMHAHLAEMHDMLLTMKEKMEKPS